MQRTIKSLLITISVGIILTFCEVNNVNIIKQKEQAFEIEKLNKEIKSTIQEIKIINTQNEEKNEIIQKLMKETSVLRNQLNASRGEEKRDLIKVKVTAYDLSLKSTGKRKSNPEYGITRTGFNLKGKTYKTARVIAVDPKVIPLHSKVKIQFIQSEYKQYDGVYTAEDTGRLVKGKHIDLFIKDSGEKECKEVFNFGVVEAYIEIID